MLDATQVTVSQGVNISLGTTAFVAVTSNLATAVSQAPSLLEAAFLLMYVAFLVFWVAKLFIENHIGLSKSEIGKKYRIFQFFANIAVFILLIVACQEINNLYISISWLLAHFAGLILWLLILGINFGKNFDYKRFPWFWFLVPVVGVIAILFLRIGNLLLFEQAGLLAVIVLAAAILDARFSRTFAS